MRSGNAAAVRIVIEPPMQYPVVPILRSPATASCASRKPTKAVASATVVSAVNERIRGKIFLRVASSRNEAPSGRTGALAAR